MPQAVATIVLALGAALTLTAPLVGCAGGDTTASTGQTPQQDAGTSDDTSGAVTNVFVVTSPGFADGGTIPAAYCLESVDGGRNESVPLQWRGAPADTASFAVTMIDLHPVAHRWVHWAVVDIPSTASSLASGASGHAMPEGSRELVSGFGKTGYGGPAPPPGSGEHRYVVTVYALDTASLEISKHPSAAEIDAALAGHVLASTSVTGVFGR